jgi:CheY-like chemotaxis protein
MRRRNLVVDDHGVVDAITVPILQKIGHSTIEGDRRQAAIDVSRSELWVDIVITDYTIDDG